MKRMISILSLLFAVLINSVVGIAGATIVGAPPLVGLLVANGTGIVLGFSNTQGLFCAKLTKEIWLSDIKEAFYPKSSFLSSVRDMSAFVNYDKINLAEAGVDPNVLVNPTTYPIPFAERTDVPHEIVLDLLATEGTVMRKSDLVELNYDKRTSVTEQHKKALLTTFAKKAIYNYAPSTGSANTPIVETTGNTRPDTTKKIKFEDILKLKTAYDLLDAPDDRVLVLQPEHYNELAAEDLTYFKGIMQNEGAILFGFKLYTFSKTPTYDSSTKNKLAYENITGLRASIAFLSSEVMKADGSYDMFDRMNDPEQLGDIINFTKRCIALPVRNKYIGAIIG